MEALHQPVLPRSPAPSRSPAPAFSHWVDFSYSFGHNCPGRMAPFKLPTPYAQAAHSPLPPARRPETPTQEEALVLQCAKRRS